MLATSSNQRSQGLRVSFNKQFWAQFCRRGWNKTGGHRYVVGWRPSLFIRLELEAIAVRLEAMEQAMTVLLSG